MTPSPPERLTGDPVLDTFLADLVEGLPPVPHYWWLDCSAAVLAVLHKLAGDSLPPATALLVAVLGVYGSCVAVATDGMPAGHWVLRDELGQIAKAGCLLPAAR
jgi:hypothetical protein